MGNQTRSNVNYFAKRVCTCVLSRHRMKKTRWISPCEIMLALGFPKHTMISRNHILSYHILGNSVSPLHAMLTVARVATIDPKCVKANPDIFQAVMMALSQVPQMNRSILQWDESVLWFEDKLTVSQSIPLCDDDGYSPVDHQQEAKKQKLGHGEPHGF